MSNGSRDFEVRIADRDDHAAIAHLRAVWTGVDSAPEFERRLSEWLATDGERRTT